jgi:hypothetical protein
MDESELEKKGNGKRKHEERRDSGKKKTLKIANTERSIQNKEEEEKTYVLLLTVFLLL